jgi:hypothetical protein
MRKTQRNEALISEGRSFEPLSWPPHSDGISLSTAIGAPFRAYDHS